MRIIKTTDEKMHTKAADEKIHRDAEALANDIRRVRNGLIDLLGSVRRRAKKRAAERRSEARKVAADLAGSSPRAVVYVEEPGQQEKTMVVERPRAWVRVLAVAFALGTAIAVLRLRRRKVTVIHRRRPRVRRVVARTVTPEPAAEEISFPGRSETVAREESKTE